MFISRNFFFNDYKNTINKIEFNFIILNNVYKTD
jgi:hypothetical protein